MNVPRTAIAAPERFVSSGQENAEIELQRPSTIR